MILSLHAMITSLTAAGENSTLFGLSTRRSNFQIIEIKVRIIEDGDIATLVMEVVDHIIKTPAKFIGLEDMMGDSKGEVDGQFFGSHEDNCEVDENYFSKERTSYN